MLDDVARNICQALCSGGSEEEEGEDPAPSSVPPPPDDPLPPLSRLTPVAPSPALRWHLLDVLAAYTLTLRAHDGDWAGASTLPLHTST